MHHTVCTLPTCPNACKHLSRRTTHETTHCIGTCVCIACLIMSTYANRWACGHVCTLLCLGDDFRVVQHSLTCSRCETHEMDSQGVDPNQRASGLIPKPPCADLDVYDEGHTLCTCTYVHSQGVSHKNKHASTRRMHACHMA